jgi:hypothetical protein
MKSGIGKMVIFSQAFYKASSRWAYYFNAGHKKKHDNNYCDPNQKRRLSLHTNPPPEKKFLIAVTLLSY